MQRVWLLSTTLGDAHGWHVPDVEYVAPVHTTQAVRLLLGPEPPWHFVQLMWFGSTTSPQLMHRVPNCEYVEPTHAAHPLRFDIGCVPGLHLLHLVFSASTTLGSGHSVHVPEME